MELKKGYTVMEDRIIYSSKFVMINNLLLSRNYRINALNAKEWKLLLYLEAHAHYKYGTTNHGHQAFNKLCPCTRTEYKKMVGRLEAMGFIRAEKHGELSKFTTITVMMTPLYDPGSQTTIIKTPRAKSGELFRIKKVHFTMVPQNVIRRIVADSSLTISQARVLLKLYRYNNLDLFNGVDCNVLRYENNRLIVAPRIPFDLAMNMNEFEYEVNELIEAAYLNRLPAKIYKEKFGQENRYRIALSGQSTSTPVDIIVPRYQYRERIAM